MKTLCTLFLLTISGTGLFAQTHQPVTYVYDSPGLHFRCYENAVAQDSLIEFYITEPPDTSTYQTTYSIDCSNAMFGGFMAFRQGTFANFRFIDLRKIALSSIVRINGQLFSGKLVLKYLSKFPEDNPQLYADYIRHFYFKNGRQDY